VAIFTFNRALEHFLSGDKTYLYKAGVWTQSLINESQHNHRWAETAVNADQGTRAAQATIVYLMNVFLCARASQVHEQVRGIFALA